MEVWIMIYAFTIVECYSPPGKSACQERGPWVVETFDVGTCRILLDEVLSNYNDEPSIILLEEPKCEQKAKLVYDAGKSKEDIEANFSDYEIPRSTYWKGS